MKIGATVEIRDKKTNQQIAVGLIESIKNDHPVMPEKIMVNGRWFDTKDFNFKISYK